MFVLVQNCVRVKCFEYKLQLSLPVRGLERRMRIQNVVLKINFPVPKCLCKQGTKNVFNNFYSTFYCELYCTIYNNVPRADGLFDRKESHICTSIKTNERDAKPKECLNKNQNVMNIINKETDLMKTFLALALYG